TPAADPTTSTPAADPTTSTPAADPTTSTTGGGTADSVGARPIVLTAFQAAATPGSLCVGVVPLPQSPSPGQNAQGGVGAWAQGGTIPDAKIQLQSTAGAGAPAFTFGCASGNGTAICDLGAVDATSAQRLFQAQVSVPATASLTSVSLTVAGSAASLPT